MTRRAAAFPPKDEGLPPVVELPANDNVAGWTGTSAARWLCVGLEAANDNWIEVAMPISIGVLAEEIEILDAFLRVEILALFD